MRVVGLFLIRCWRVLLSRSEEMAVAIDRLCFYLNPKVNLILFSMSGRRFRSFDDFLTCYLNYPSCSFFSRHYGFTVIARISANGDVKLKIDVSSSKTQVIFDDVLSRLVAAAQPIPGFRRLKGGKTPDIPKDILMHLLGPSKVNKQSIQKIINTAVAEYVEKEGLKVTRDLKVDETFEELEAVFKPGEAFAFNATIRLLETDKKKP
ncbi:unnamed protein product [Spirodela intermedia]|uniref:peptidylprolyl isomerase n=1 Tax=Spirodela intermedia TaxID=51605 RepID=A0A7I8ITN4_SPIIN|nr:unnamed protein product [Spirodela intermedia]CAA6660324.1 unnamed protein product [Spirodela intermedia]